MEETKAKRLNVIISLGDESKADLCKALVLKSSAIGDTLKGLGAIRWHYILHSLDFKDDGTIKTPHYHIWVEFPSGKRPSTWVNAFAQAFGLSPFAFTLNKATSEIGCVQYMVHKHNPDKHQYDPAMIVTSVSPEELKVMLESESEAWGYEYLIGVIKSSDSLADVIRSVGIERYRLYRNVIKDLIDNLVRS